MKVSEVWKKSFEGYVPEKNRLMKIFDENSEWNKRQLKYCGEYDKYDVDLMKEIQKLGFRLGCGVDKPSYIQGQSGNYMEYSFLDKQNNPLIIYDHNEFIIAEYKGFEFCEHSDGIIGKSKRDLLTWLMGFVSND